MTSSPTPEGPDTDARRGLSRRTLIGAAAAAAASLGSGLTQSAAASTRSSKAPGSISRPPNPPEGFTSEFINANGLSQHVVIGGEGPPLLLVHGWPQFWYAWRHFMFNKLSTMNVQLVHGREDIFFGFIFATDAFNQLPSCAVHVYVNELASSLASLRGSVGYYRASDATAAQNQQRVTTPLTLPVLAIGGAEGLGAAVAETMQLAATNVQTLVIPSCGHFVPEEAPEELLAALIPFLTA